MSVALSKSKAEPAGRHPRGKALVVWGVPEDIKVRFKTACAKNRTTMQKAVIEFLRNYK